MNNNEAKLNVKLLNFTPSPEATVAMAAKLCYSNADIAELQEKIAESDVEKFVAMLADMKHESPVEHISFTFGIEGVSRACYDKDTEIYTIDGWQKFEDLNKDSLIMTRNSGGYMEFNKPDEIIKYHLRGKMHKYKSQSFDLVVTPNHSLYAKKYDIRIPQDFSLIKSEDVHVERLYFTKRVKTNVKVNDIITIPGYSYNRKNNQGVEYTKILPSLILNKEYFFKFLAWYLSEGSIYFNKEENSYCISISQKECESNKENRKEIVNIVHELGFAAYEDKDKIRFKNLQLGRWLKEIGISYEKYIPFNIHSEFNQYYANIFIDTYKKADASTDKSGHVKLYTTSKKLADQLQMICFISGKSALIWKDNRVGERHYIDKQEVVHKHECYVISISEGARNINPVMIKKRHFKETDYNDMVYCVNVKNHVIFVRRNGNCLWCGNCTHQLVRHRIASFSQKSQRYVREGQFEYIVPEPMKISPKAVEIFIKHMEEDQRTYDELVNILEEEFLSKAVKNIVNKPNSRTPNPIKHILIGFLEDDNIEEVVKKDLKKILSTCEKKAIENARYVLPNACETKIVLTMNARSLLHFFNLRCCSRAQDEIRNLAIAMLKECKAVAPSIFKNAGPSCVSSPCPEGNMSCGKFFEMRKFFQSL